MTAPDAVSRLRSRDASLCLAVAATLRLADDSGGVPFGALAIGYREDYLAALGRVAGDLSRPDPGTLSVDDVRRHLAASVLPRLATEGIIEEYARGWAQDTPARFRPAIWEQLGPIAGEARRDLLEAAARGMITHSTGEHAARIASPGRASVVEGVNLTKSYNRRAVVDDVHVRLAQGEIVGLLGPNGAGKTTTFYMLVGLIAPERGRILLDGEEISGLPMFERARRGIGYLA